MNYTTRQLTEDEFHKIISTLEMGYEYKGIQHRPNRRVATALATEATLGIRISDVLNLRLSSIERDGDKHRLNIKEKKTGKSRTFVVPNDVYMYLKGYAFDCKLSEDQKLFDIRERQVQKILRNVCEYLGLKRISTHSFRKLFATRIYENTHDVALVSRLLQHSSISTTSRYIGVSDQRIDDALGVAENLLEYVKK